MELNAIDRLRQFINYQDISVRRFFLECGLSEGSFTKTKSIGSENLKKIVYKYPALNMDWVISGRGEMLFRDKTEMIVGADVESASTAIEALKSQVARYKDEVMGLKDELIICLKEKDAERTAKEKLVEQFQKEKAKLIKDFTNTHSQKQVEK